MERVSLIINKLYQLVQDGASVDILLAIAQMLIVELESVQEEGGNHPVSVILPRKVVQVLEVKNEEEVERNIEVETIEPYVPSFLSATTENLYDTPVSNFILAENDGLPTYKFSFNEETAPLETEKPVEEYILTMPEEASSEAIVTASEPTETNAFDFNSFLFDTTENEKIPTLPAEETMETPVASNVLPEERSEVNNMFKEHKVEVAHLLENTHIKDLKKAISINDKYLFINELFNGDEGLYDRSIKHIQNFSILPEATFWIQRELKTKLNWHADDEVVQLFDQLVKRRFS